MTYDREKEKDKAKIFLNYFRGWIIYILYSPILARKAAERRKDKDLDIFSMGKDYIKLEAVAVESYQLL